MFCYSLFVLLYKVVRSMIGEGGVVIKFFNSYILVYFMYIQASEFFWKM
jgi:hypothetical protein